MSKSALKAKAKQQKKDKTSKKSVKRIVIFVVCVAAVFGLIFLPIYSAGRKNAHSRQGHTAEAHSHDEQTAETYSYRGQTIALYSDGHFHAVLAHNVRKDGTYTKANESGVIIVSFNVNGNIERGRIIDNALHLPDEWNDGHGHGSVFPRTNEAPSAERHDHDH